ncbi:MAG: cytochrome c biogenesis protein ResB [Deltaproteobacteria bacterium]
MSATGATLSAGPSLPGVALRRRDRDVVDSLWDFFASLKLTIPLMFLLASACTLGTFANPENRPMTEIRAAIGHAWWYPGYLFFELNDLFHSWWFVLLLVVLTFNLIACTIERLPRIFKIALRPERRLGDVQLRGIKHQLRLRASSPPLQEAGAVAGLLRARGFEPEILRGEPGTPDEGTAFVFAEKGRYSRFGVWIVHLSLFLILTGALVGRILGMEGVVNVPMDGGSFDFIFRKNSEGVTFRQPLGFTVRVDDFRLEKYLDGKPRSFESDLVVLGPDGRELDKQTIKVGDPLEWGGWTFYQASYQAEPTKDRVSLTFKDLTGKGGTREVKLGRDGETDLPGGVRYKVLNYTERFAGLGPAVELARTSPEGKETSFWVFQRYPGFDAENRGDTWGVDLTGLAPYYFTGLQVARDPGYIAWLIGCCILFLGLGIAFYTSHRRLWARVRQNGEVVVAGAAHKNQSAFETVFDELAQALARSHEDRRG